MLNQEVADIATRALDLLRQRGWARGTAENSRGGICLGQACLLATGQTGVNAPYAFHSFCEGEGLRPVHEAITAVVREQWPDESQRLDWGTSIAIFNDSTKRRFADIELVLEKVIARTTG